MNSNGTNATLQTDTFPEEPSGAELEPIELDPPSPALARWRALAEIDHDVEHDGDVEKILGQVHPRPKWSDPERDQVGRSHLSCAYVSEPVEVISSHNFGVDHDDWWEPARAYVSAKLYGNSHESVSVTFSQVKDDGAKSSWQNIAMSFQPHEALELADALRAAVELLGTQ